RTYLTIGWQGGKQDLKVSCRSHSRTALLGDVTFQQGRDMLKRLITVHFLIKKLMVHGWMCLSRGKLIGRENLEYPLLMGWGHNTQPLRIWFRLGLTQSTSTGGWT
ncbi:MAG: hypothetical protein ACRC7H_00050, partial [Plesiomonas shigelloides]